MTTNIIENVKVTFCRFSYSRQNGIIPNVSESIGTPKLYKKDRYTRREKQYTSTTSNF